ncbi:MAG: 3-hydroxybutyryl-CoA dehydrogenase [Saprospiraceae bacterium]|nr:3-hydroxybutyryl-CoA dehydrogenase [Saprospiraceae bacterium]
MNNITVIGAGTMGNGIAHVFAQYGYQVILCDISQTALDKALVTIEKNMGRMVEKQKISEQSKRDALGRLTTSTELSSAVSKADLVIEAATENLDLKLKIFAQIDQFSPENAILATNTSSISITKIASATKRPEKVIGMHFMNPVPVIRLVEVIRGFSTSNEVCELIFEISKKIDKVPVEVKDYPGFVANRLLMAMLNEAIHTLYDGICGVEEIDTIMKLGMTHQMGPLLLADFIGLDVCLSIMKVIHEGFGNPKYAPSPLLINMVNAGLLGVKNGSGFYLHSKDSKELVVNPKFLSRFS